MNEKSGKEPLLSDYGMGCVIGWVVGVVGSFVGMVVTTIALHC